MTKQFMTKQFKTVSTEGTPETQSRRRNFARGTFRNVRYRPREDEKTKRGKKNSKEVEATVSRSNRCRLGVHRNWRLRARSTARVYKVR